MAVLSFLFFFPGDVSCDGLVSIVYMYVWVRLGLNVCLLGMMMCIA